MQVHAGARRCTQVHWFAEFIVQSLFEPRHKRQTGWGHGLYMMCLRRTCGVHTFRVLMVGLC